jgi:NADH dehydrogenase
MSKFQPKAAVEFTNMSDSTNLTLILGGGFTGLFTALHLSHQRCSLPTILIDQEWSFIFKPLLYEFLSGEMNVQLVWPRYDDLLHNSGVAFVRDTIQDIDLHQRQVRLTSGLCYTYRHLVLALGSTSGYFGVSGAKENTLPFRTGEDAIALGRHLRDCLQKASQTEDLQRRTLLTVTILGAGRSGIELAATLADLLPDWYAPLGGNIAEIRIVVIQRGKEILKGDTDSLRSSAESALQKGTVPVELLLEAEVSAVHPHEVQFKRHNSSEALSAATIIWTTGTAINPLIKALPVPVQRRDKQGRLQVTPTLQLPDFPEVFAGGDCAVDQDHPLPATAQVAYQQGAAIAHNIKAISEGSEPTQAQVRLRETLMKLGLEESVAEIFDRFEVKGKLGHLIRQGTYIELLPKPVHNFKATTEWLTDEFFHQFANV